MSHPLKLKISDDGQIVMAYHPDKQAEEAEALSQALGTVTEDARGARVRPANAVLSVAFKALRAVFGGSGKVANWTRGWGCRWLVCPEGEQVCMPVLFGSHDEAVQFEVAWIMGVK